MPDRPGPLSVTCPTCDAPPRRGCHTASGKPTGPHQTRRDAAIPLPTAEEIARREHEHRIFTVRHTSLVRLTWDYSCGCSDGPGEPLPLGEANVYGVAGAIICDRCDEYATVVGQRIELVDTKEQLRRILLAADVDELTADCVAAEQSGAARAAARARTVTIPED